MNKKVLLPFLALAVLAFGTLTMQSIASAEELSDPQSKLVEKISTKFGLNKEEVQKVFDEQRAEIHAQMQAKNEDRLNQLVKDGKITEAQKKLIINKQKELISQREENRGKFKDLTPDEKKSQMEAKKTELESWAKENEIDPTYLFPGKRMMSGREHRMGM